MRAVLLLTLAAVSAAAQDTAPSLANLGRLSIARVFASGRQGGSDAETFYGVRNAFDGGSNILNGINYSSWDAGPEDFAIVRFSRPVTVTGIVVEGSRSSYTPSPEGFTVQIRSAGSQELFLSPYVGLEDQLAIYATPQPLVNVREVVLTFKSRSVFGVEEIEILGPAPRGVSTTPVTPPRDMDLARSASSESQANGRARKALIRRLAAKQIAGMRTARSTIDQAADSTAKARAWLDLNRAADRLAKLLGSDKDLEPLAMQASALGIAVDWCDPGSNWFAHAEGFERYLQILPDGPQADDAWWMRRFRDCGDSEGTAEEYEEEIQWYSEFLKRFPNSSSHAPDARQALSDAQKEYKAARPN